MRSRWTILAVLFIGRAAMAFQFQSVGAVAPLVSDSLRASLADIGILIGLYLAPGVALALPGATIGQRYGDRATVLAGLLMMLAGETLMTSSAPWSLQISGRLIGGTGGVLLNVLMTKMVADWFAGREIATAMAIYINSWPAGIAIALMLLPAFAWWLLASVLLGLGTAMVYPSLIAAVSDASHPSWRARSLSVYRFWRDLGYAIGALSAADFFGLAAAITAVAALSCQASSWRS